MMMGIEIDPKISFILYHVTWLLAREDFIDLTAVKASNLKVSLLEV
jgi:hypothetical protein